MHTGTSIAIVGGHGKISRALIPLLVAGGHHVIALARREEQLADLEALGAEARRLDIEAADEGDFAVALAGCDAVVFSAGGGPDGNIERKRTVDLEGSLMSITAAQVTGINRFVQVSAMRVDRPVDPTRGEVWAAYVAAKRDADEALRDSGLAWTILRPGGLTDGPGTGLVTLAAEVEPGRIPRADVAAVIATVLDNPATDGKQWEVVSGSTPIAEAIAAAV